MKRRKSLLLFTLPLCTSCGVNSDQLNNIINFNVTPAVDEEVCLANDDVEDFFHNYSQGYSTIYQGKGDNYINKDLVFSWNKYSGASYYKVRYSFKSDLSDYKEVKVNTNSLSISDFFTNVSVYWKIIPYSSKNFVLGQSPIYNFFIEPSPRTIYLDGVSNTRDMGGYDSESGYRIKQGMIYRAATLDNISDDGINKNRDVFGIKTDLDLRKSNEGKAGLGSPLGDDVKYLNNPGPYWIDANNGVNASKNFPAMKKSLKMFADPNNYPIVFHCSLGQDRTGSLAYILGALLGMSPKDLAMDYEMSSFSEAVGYTTNHIEIRNKFTYQYNPLVDYINSFGEIGYSLMDKAEAYCLAVGLTDEEIQAIRDIMWEA